MSHGVLAVRRGSKGSYLLDTSAPLPAKIHYIPSVDVVVSDPTGAGNAYSAAFAVNLAKLLGEKVIGSTPGGARRREESVVTAGDEPLYWITSRAIRNFLRVCVCARAGGGDMKFQRHYFCCAYLSRNDHIARCRLPRERDGCSCG
jgi:hypothetical protein